MDGDFIEEFVMDMEDMLEKLEKIIIKLEKDKTNTDILNELFRVMHSVKGIAAMMELHKMENLTHNMENLLFEVRDGKIEMSEEIINLLLVCKDYLDNFLENLKINKNTEEKEGSFIEETIKKINSMTKKTLKKKKEQIVTERCIKINDDIKEKIRDSGEKVYKIRVTFEKNSLMKKIKAYLIFKMCMEKHYIFGEVPSLAEIENEENIFDEKDIFFSVVTNEAVETIKAEILKTGEIESIVSEEIDNLKNTLTYKFENEQNDSKKIKFMPVDFREQFKKEIEIQNNEIENTVIKDINSTLSLNIIYRNFHTISGIAKMIGKSEIVSISIETMKYLSVIKEKIDIYNENDIKNLILNSTQIIKILTDTEEKINENIVFKMEYQLSMLEIAVKRKEILNKDDFKELIKNINTVSDNEINKVKELKNIQEIIEQSEIRDDLAEIIKFEVKEDEQGKSSEIRVATVKIEKLNELISELQMIQSVVEEKSKTECSNLLVEIIKMMKITKEIQNLSVSMNNLTLKNLYQKMNRVFRDAVKKSGKKAQLILKGENTEIERAALEKITEPMIHIIKNTISHGIEDKDERIKAEKSEIGVVKIEGYTKQNNIYLEISDDGRGVDIERVYRKAIEKGITAKNREECTKKEIICFLFAPGFSTAEKVDELAGRGVGMDVVKSEIEKIGGNVEIESEIGKGTSVILRIPVNSMVINGTVVEMGNQKYIIPTHYIKEIADARTIENINVMGVEKFVKIREHIIKYTDINKILKIKNDRGRVMIVVESGNRESVFIVDKIVDRRDVTVTGLNIDSNEKLPFNGAAILGDGRIYLIIDIEYILNLQK